MVGQEKGPDAGDGRYAKPDSEGGSLAYPVGEHLHGVEEEADRTKHDEHDQGLFLGHFELVGEVIGQERGQEGEGKAR